MWIKTQTRYCLMNMDNMDYICIDLPRKGIACKYKDESIMLLATYNTMEDCKKVFEGLNKATLANIPVVELPLGGDIDSWVKTIDDATRNWLILNHAK